MPRYGRDLQRDCVRHPPLHASTRNFLTKAHHPPRFPPRFTHHAMKSLFHLLLASLSLLAATARAQNPVNGNLLLETKGQAELYLNGKKIPLRNEADNKQHFRVKLPTRSFKAGDVIIVRILSPYAYRATAVAINLDGKAGQIPIKRNDWRFLGETKNPTKFTAADVHATKDIPVLGAPDGHGTFERDKLEMVPAAKGGSDWVASPTLLRDWYSMGFVLTPQMFKKPLPAP
jgi:hypothetical protein